MSMIGDGKSGVWLAWIDNRQSTVGLYVQEIDGNGSRLQGAKGKPDRRSTSQTPPSPQLTSPGSWGKAVVFLGPIGLKKGQWQLFWIML